MTLPDLPDTAAVFVFALIGALAACPAQIDIVGFAFAGSLTAAGGGTSHDVIPGRDGLSGGAASLLRGPAGGGRDRFTSPRTCSSAGCGC